MPTKLVGVFVLQIKESSYKYFSKFCKSTSCDNLYLCKIKNVYCYDGSIAFSE